MSEPIEKFTVSDAGLKRNVRPPEFRAPNPKEGHLSRSAPPSLPPAAIEPPLGFGSAAILHESQERMMRLLIQAGHRKYEDELRRRR